jgi:hypothetical protein
MLRAKSAAYSAEDLVDDAAAVLDALHWPAAHVLGGSFGGVIAQRLALRHPDRVLTLTSFASGPSDAGSRTVLLRYVRWERQLRLLPLMLRVRGGDPTTGPDLLRAVATTAYPIEESYLHDAMARDQAQGITSFTDFAAQGRQTGATWHGPPLRELHRPALVMCGDADPMLRPRASRDTAAAIPGAPGHPARRRPRAPTRDLAHRRPADPCPRRQPHLPLTLAAEVTLASVGRAAAGRDPLMPFCVGQWRSGRPTTRDRPDPPRRPRRPPPTDRPGEFWETILSVRVIETNPLRRSPTL